MKRYKFILLILFILLFSGCSGNYNLTFNKDLTVNEELKISIDNERDNYERTHKLFEKAEIDPDKYQIVIDKSKVNINYKEKYSNFSDYYLNSKLYKVIFDNVDFKRDNTGISINAENNFKLDDKDNQNIINSYDISKLNINITTPFTVNNSNADTIKNNTYTWVIRKSDTYKNISFDYSYKNDNVSNILLIVLMGLIFVGIIIYLIIYFIKNQRV